MPREIDDEAFRSFAQKVAGDVFTPDQAEFAKVLEQGNCYSAIVPKMRDLPIEHRVEFVDRLLRKLSIPGRKDVITIWREMETNPWFSPAEEIDTGELEHELQETEHFSGANVHVFTSETFDIKGFPEVPRLLAPRARLTRRQSIRSSLLDRVTQQLLPNLSQIGNYRNFRGSTEETLTQTFRTSVDAAAFPKSLPNESMGRLKTLRHLYQNGLCPLGFDESGETFYVYCPPKAQENNLSGLY